MLIKKRRFRKQSRGRFFSRSRKKATKLHLLTALTNCVQPYYIFYLIYFYKLLNRFSADFL